MKKEITIGGRYFSLKRTEDKDGTRLYLLVEDVIEVVKEIGAKEEKVKKYVPDGDWKCAIEEVAKYLANVIDEHDMTIHRQINVDFDMIDWEKGFNYEDSVSINGDKAVITITTKRHGWLMKFVREFVNEYNKLI